MKDTEKVARRADKVLHLREAKLSLAYYYQSLPYCVIDSIFSLGVRYEQVERVVDTFSKNTKWRIFRESGSSFPKINQQRTISEFLAVLLRYKDPACTLFDNRGLANPSSKKNKPIRKASLVKQFATVLLDENVETFQDLQNCKDITGLINKLCALPALKSEVAISYFRMLAGDDSQVKADRMIRRFVAETLTSEDIPANQAAELIQEAANILQNKYPVITPRLLDHEIWKYQRSAQKGKYSSHRLPLQLK